MEYLFKSTALISVFMCFYWLFLQKETHFTSNRFYFVVSIIASLILPFIVYPIYINAPMIEQLPMKFIETPTEKISVITNETPSAKLFMIDWFLMIKGIYLVGIITLLIKFMIDIVSLYRLLRQSDKLKEEHITFVQTLKNISPFSVFNYIVYNKKMFTSEELEQIILHEKTHVNQKHSYDLLLVNLLVILQWFNPFVWIFKKKLEQNLEYIADHQVAKQSNNIKNYQYLLLKTSVKENPFALSTNFYNSLIKKRIIMLQKPPTKKKNYLKLLLLLPLISVFIFAFNKKEIVKTPESNLFIEAAFEEVSNEPLFVSPINKENILNISSGFGKRMHPIQKVLKFHNGIDLVAHKDTDVYAAANGTIIDAGFDKLNGNYIQIKHKNGFQTNYHHLGGIQIEVGEEVKAGEIISNVGVSGKSTGPHLHFEVIKNGKWINPTSILQFNDNNTIEKEEIKTIIKIQIDKTTTNKELDKVKSMLKKEGVAIKFKGIKRNKQNEITAIKINAEYKGNKSSYAVKKTSPIKPIVIKVTKDEVEIFTDDLEKRKHGKHVKMKWKSDDSKEHEEHEDHDVIFIKKGDKDGKKIIKKRIVKKYEYKSDHSGKDGEHKVITVKSDGGKDKIIINGKEVSIEDIKNGKHGDVHIEVIEDINMDEDGKHKRIKIISNHLDEDIDLDINVDDILENVESDNFVFISGDDQNAKIIVNGKEVTNEELKKMSKEDIKTIEIHSEKHDIKKDENGNIIKSENIFIKKIDGSNENVKFIVNGKEMSKEELKKMKPEDIKTLEIKKEKK